MRRWGLDVNEQRMSVGQTLRSIKDDVLGRVREPGTEPERGGLIDIMIIAQHPNWLIFSGSRVIFPPDSHLP